MSILDLLSRAFGIAPAEAAFLVPKQPPPALGNQEGLLPWAPPAPAVEPAPAPAPRIGFMPRASAAAPEPMGPPMPPGPPTDGMHLIGSAVRQGLFGGVPGPSTGLGAFVDQNFGGSSPAMRLVGALAGAPPQEKAPAPAGGTKTFGLPAGLFDPSGGARTTETIIPGKPNWEDALVQRESGGRPDIVNPLGYAGKYQFGAPLLQTLGVYTPGQGEDLKGWSKTGRDAPGKWSGTFNIPGHPEVRTLEDFKRSPEAQKSAFDLSKTYYDGEIERRGLGEFIGKTVAGVPITKEGLYTGMHLGGAGGVEQTLRSGGSYNAEDANGTTVLNYIKMGSEGGTGGMPRAQRAFSPQLPEALRLTAPQLPDAPRMLAPQYGAAPTLEAPPVRDLSAAREYLKGARPTYRESPGPEENFFRIMANLGGGADTKGGIGSVLLGSAGSAGHAMTRYIDNERGRKDDFDTRQLPGWMTNMANFERAAAGDIQSDQAAVVATRNTNAVNADSRANKQIDANVGTANKNADAEFDQKVKQLGLNFDVDKSNAVSADQRLREQVKLDASVTNADIQQKNQEEITKWKLSLPEVKPTKDGYMVTTMDPESGRQRIVTHTRENFNSRIDDLIKRRKLGGGLGDQEYYMEIARAGNTPGVKRAVVDDMIDRGALKDVIGEKPYNQWLSEAKKSFPPEMTSDAKVYNEAVNKRLNDIILMKIESGEIPDAAWIPKMAALGNAGARLLMMGGTK